MEYFGVSHRTGRPLSKPPQSSIRAHSDTHDHRLKLSNFSALMSCHNSNDLGILESMFIHKLKSQLNDYQLANTLSISA